MALSVGSRLGPYEIVAPLGAGGMGEVYRARDTKLNRDVAIKVLPDFVRHRSRSARAVPARSAGPRVTESSEHRAHPRLRGHRRRSARSSWNWSRARRSRERIAQGPIPLDEALPIAQADRRGARGGARAGDRPSRSEAREHQGPRRRHGEGAGLRAGESARARAGSAAAASS